MIEDAARLLGPRARRDVALGPLTTYGVGGPASLFVEAAATADLFAVAEAVAATGIDVLVVGRGSNMLVSDSGFDGVALTLGAEFSEIEITTGEFAVRAGAAVTLPVLARRTAAAGLTGLEWAVGVPGSVGGAVRMNAGGHGSDVSESLAAATVVDLTAGSFTSPARLPAAQLDLGYRRSSVGPLEVVTEAEFELAPGDRQESEARVAEIVRWRREHQPGGSNAGSVFTNPPGDSAGRLIDAAGLKGFRVGSATVSPKHANFFQVDAGGSADDVLAVMEAVQAKVLEHAGITLIPEVRLVGFHHSRLELET